MITRCPKCETHFEVTSTQLSAAEGTVRCGQCLNIFSARENTVHEKILETASMSSSTDNYFHPQSFAQQEDSAFETQSQTANTPEAATCEPAHDNNPESKWLNDLIFQDPPNSSLEQDQQTAETTLSSFDANDRIEPSVNGDLEFDNSEFNNNDELDDIPSYLSEHKPTITLEKRSRRSFFSASFLWLLASGFLLFLLLLQWMWVERERLSTHAFWSPHIETLCQFISCSPKVFSANKIAIRNYRIENLNIYAHPSKDKILIVELTLLNLTKIERPFPNIELAFTDLEQNPIAQRIFSRADYLHGELTGQQNIPAETPVFIGLEILEPSDQALNYSVQVVAP